MMTEIGTYIGTGLGVFLLIMANWMIFKKAGRPGWQCLIPFYNVYAQYKMCWKGWIGVFSMLLSAAIAALAYFEIAPAILIPMVAVELLIQFIFCFKLAKAFGKGFLMGLVLAFTVGFGRLILGFGRSKYVGAAA